MKAVEDGLIKIIPFKTENLNPCSVDLTLSSEFTFFNKKQTIDPKDLDAGRAMHAVDTKGEAIQLKPGQFVLAKTVERIAISKDIAATLEGRSGVARLGIVVHAAGLVNPGSGMSKPVPLVLEVFCQNASPVKLYPSTKIVQIIFHRLSSPARRGYDEIQTSRFVGQD